MKQALVTIAGISQVAVQVPASIDELSLMIDKDNSERANSVVLNAANQYFLQQHLIRVRTKIAEALTAKHGIEPRIFAGKVQVEAVKDGDKITGYKAIDGKKTFKADDKSVKVESSNAFIDYVVAEKQIKPESLKKLVQKVVDDNPFTAEQKRVRGSVASKPVGAKWTKLAEKIVAAGNAEKAAAKLTEELGTVIDVSGDDRIKRLALALSEKARKAREAEEAQAAAFGTGTAEEPLVVDGTKA